MANVHAIFMPFLTIRRPLINRTPTPDLAGSADGALDR
jgi:hypothetical protein